MLRSASMPVKMALIGLALFCCFAVWIFISNSKEEPGRIDASPQAAQTNQPDRDNAQPGGRTSGPTRTPDSQPPPSSPPPTNDTLMEAGGPSDGPLPKIPGGGCPEEFPVEQPEGCYIAQ